MKNNFILSNMVQAITVLTVLKMMTRAQTSCGNGPLNGKVMYERLPNTQLQGFDDDIVRDTAPPFMVLEKCQDLCLRDRSSNNIVRTCSSFDFQPGSRIATFNGGPEYEESTCYLTREQAVPEGIGNLMLVPNSVHFSEVCITSNRPDRECPNRRYIFERHPRKKLKLPSADLKEIQSSNKSECEDKCLNEFSFVCRSASYDSAVQTCSLSRFTRRTHPELLEDDPSSDYLENTCLSADRRCDGLAVFIKEENKRLSGPFEVDHYSNLTLEDCQAMCVRAEKYFCRSIEYDEMSRHCTISEEDSISQKDDIAVSSSPTHNFYDFACLDSPRGSEYPDNSVTSHLFTGKRPDTAFQRYRNSRLGGEHHSEISGRSLSECLDECLRQPSFQCRSAVYSERYRTCRLSRYNQKDGMRIIYDADYDYYENLMLGSDGEGGNQKPDIPFRPEHNRPGGYRPGDGYPPERYPPGYRPDRERYPGFDNRIPDDRYPPQRHPWGPYPSYPKGPDRYPITPVGRPGPVGRYPDDRDVYPPRYPPPDRFYDRYPSRRPPISDREIYYNRDRDQDRYGGGYYPHGEPPYTGDPMPGPYNGDQSRYGYGYRGDQFIPEQNLDYDNYGVKNRYLPGPWKYPSYRPIENEYERPRDVNYRRTRPPFNYYGGQDNNIGGNRWSSRPDIRPLPRPVGRPPYSIKEPNFYRRPFSPGPDGPIYEVPNIGIKPFYSRCDQDGNFKQAASRQRIRKDFVRRFIVANTLDQCELECAEVRDFVCRSFNYRDGPPLYDEERENCELSDRDSRDIDISNPQYFESTGNFDYYERSNSRQGADPNCLDVSQVCNDDGMEFTLRTPEGFYGRIYTYGFYDRCFFRGNGGTLNVLRISGAQGYPECGTQRYGDTMTNIVVVQFSDYVQTGKDKRFNLTCLFRGPGEAVVSSGFIGAGSGSPIPIEYLPAENTLSSKVRLMILYQGRPTTTIAVGDPLTFRLEAQDGYNYVQDIFATNVVARDPYSGRSVQLIDRFGCPVDSYVFPELDRGRSGDSLEARFNAFKIPESNFLVFEATVRTCREGCQPAYCPTQSGRSEPSFGRRRRDLNNSVDANDTIDTIDTNILLEDDTQLVNNSVSFPSGDRDVELNENKQETPEFVREMIEVFESREELQQEARRAVPLSDSLCITSSEYHGLISATMILLTILIVMTILFGITYRRYVKYTQKPPLREYASSRISSSYPNTRSDGLSSIFGNSLQNPFKAFGKTRNFPSSVEKIDVDCSVLSSDGPFDDPSEPIYTNPSLFERSRSLRSISVIQKQPHSPDPKFSRKPTTFI